MKKLALVVAALTLPAIAQAQAVHVRGYTRSDGTYVAPHYRSAPNSTTTDNWTTRGNVNPYTGEQGTRDPVQPRNTYPTISPNSSYQPYRPTTQPAKPKPW